LKLAVNALDASGGTNIEAGVTTLGSIFTGGASMPDSLVMLTDGYVNEGITSTAGIHSLLKSYLPNVPVYALGYGDDHNSDFMKGISSRTNGTYTFINNEIALPASVGDMLGGLQCEVAKAGRLAYPTTWTCLELNGDSTGSYGVGSLIADKPTWVMFDVPYGANGSLVLDYKLVLGDVVTTNVVVTQELDRIDVMEQHLRCLTAVALDNAADAIKNYRIDDAKRAIEGAIDKISVSEAGSRPLAFRMRAQLEEMRDEISQMVSTPPRNRSRFTNLALRTSNTATRYQQQRGVGGTADDSLFTSPIMLERQSQMIYDYSQTIPDDPLEMSLSA
jgi:hypothetical protein